jgi:hypothetical protein
MDDEFVELFNAGQDPIDIKRLCDERYCVQVNSWRAHNAQWLNRKNDVLDSPGRDSLKV